MPAVVFHYTSRQAAQEIYRSAWLIPGASGKVYFTEDIYTRGVDAAEQLALTGKTIEAVFVVLIEQVRDLSDEQLVEPVLDEAGRELRSGGGHERWTPTRVPLADPSLFALTWP